MRRELGLLLACMALASCKRARPLGPDATLTFTKDGATVRALPLSELAKAIPPETVSGFDPYHRKPKRFRALPLKRVLEAGFPGESLADKEFVLRAKDGYAVYFRGELAVTEGGYVAFEDLDVPSWEPIGPQRADPSPFYVVWSKPEQAELEAFPRPWQLVKIEMVRFDVAYPHTSPGSAASATALAGYALFRDRCFKCHAINREGGRVGPDLAVPKNVLEYRPVAQVRAYVKDPLSFRYGNMPPHPDLTEAQLDALVAYLEAMKDRKYDPGK
ncbi:MAG: cytochrome c [Myxococcales bacterium]|nr:cytochrome c [Myxococcales bacterium]